MGFSADSGIALQSDLRRRIGLRPIPSRSQNDIGGAELDTAGKGMTAVRKRGYYCVHKGSPDDKPNR